MITKAPEELARSVASSRGKQRARQRLAIAFLLCLAALLVVWFLSKQDSGWDPYWYNNDAIF